MIGGVKTIDHNDVSPGLLILDSFNNGYGCSDGGIKTEPADFGKTYITLDKAGWQGSTTTIIEERTLPVAVVEDFNNHQGYGSRPETPVTSTRGPGRRPGRRSAKVESEDEASSPEEAERLRVRRERNKEAAARCRKRKMDQIETLEKQVADWEARNKDLQRKMQELKEEKDAVTFMLENHDCQKTFHNNQQQHQHQIATTQEYILPTMVNINTNTCTTTNQQILRVPHVPTTIVTLSPSSTMLTTSEKALASSTHKVVVKAESKDDFAYPSAVHRTTEEILHNTEPQAPIILSAFDEESHYQPIAKKSRRSRPESLSLQVKPQNYRSVVGVTIETPTNIFNTPTFDALMDGRTGLTPTNVLTPVCISLSALTTPVLSSPTCSIQQRNNAPNSNGKSFELMSL